MTTVITPATPARPRDEWDEIPDEELEETLAERLEGLGEAVPEPVRRLASSSYSWSKYLVSNAVWLTRNVVWIAATSSMILFLPYIIEKERADLEKTQLAQQRQMLLGPAAAAVPKKP